MMEVNHPRGDFVNVYEESKWEAEQLWMGEATILRPSIIVGDSETGRCCSFGGWYILFQAVHLLDRLLRDANGSGPNRLASGTQCSRRRNWYHEHHSCGFSG